MVNSIHRTAVVHPTALIGVGSIIGPNVTIEEGVVIGPYSVIGGMPEHASFYDDTECNRSKGVYIEKDARIFEFVTIHAGTKAPTFIGRRAALFNHTHIAHDCRLEPYSTIGGHNSLAGHVHVMENAVVSGKSAIHQWSVVGAYAILSGNSFLKGFVPPGEKWIGNPARPAGINNVGLGRGRLSFGECTDRFRDRFELLKKESRLTFG